MIENLCRCFPHCCPEHSYTTFCSSSIGIRVSNVQEYNQDDVAYLRFHATSDILLIPGQEIPQATVLNRKRNGLNPKGEWIPSHLGQYNARLGQLLYHFNHNNSVGWHYGWIGTQYTMTHNLVAYVLRPFSTTTGKQMYLVLAVHPSPPFIVMSYRRACFHCQKHKPFETGPVDAIDTCRCEGGFNVTSGILPQTIPSLTKSMPNAIIPANAAHATTFTRVPIMECQMAIIYHFLHNLPSSVFGTARCQRALETSVVFPILEHLAMKWPSSRENKIKTSLLFRQQSDDILMTAESLMDAGIDPVVIMCIHVVGAVVLFLLKTNPRLCTSYTSVLFHHDLLFEAYASWLNKVYIVANKSLTAMYESSLSQLVMDIIKLTPKFGSLRSLQSRIHQLNTMEAQATVGFNYFVVQLREVYLAQQHSVSLNPKAISVFNQRWHFDTIVSNEHNSDLSLGSILRTLLVGYAFELSLDKSTLLVRSALIAYDTIPTIFELDGASHVHRVFPHGESTMNEISQLSHGDYCGWIEDETTLVVELYSWAVQAQDSTKNRSSYKMRVTLTVTDGKLNMVATLHEIILESPEDVSTSPLGPPISTYTQGKTLIAYHVMYTSCEAKQ